MLTLVWTLILHSQIPLESTGFFIALINQVLRTQNSNISIILHAKTVKNEKQISMFRLKPEEEHEELFSVLNL